MARNLASRTRALVASALALLALPLLLSAAPRPSAPLALPASLEIANEPVAVFAGLEGDWVGTFVGFDAAGKELYRIAVKQSYRRLDANTQEVVLADTDAAGKTIRGKGRNVATRRADGTLELRCIVDKENGDHVEHEGRLVKGPDGDEELIWFVQREGRSETFRERCLGSGADARYEIDGMGRYGDSLVLMAGRYRRP